MAIRYKLGLIVGCLSLIILSMFTVTWYTTSLQKADSLVINLAGRERMLSQKMSKDLFLFSFSKDAIEKEKLALSIRNTMKVFDISLTALTFSGKAPLTLDLKGEYSECPKAVEPVFSQLKKVQNIWKKFSLPMEEILSGKSNSLDYIIKNNMVLLAEMNKAVVLLQKVSEKKVSNLIIFQTIGVLFGLALMVISVVQISRIVKKLMDSASIAKKICTSFHQWNCFILCSIPSAKTFIVSLLRF